MALFWHGGLIDGSTLFQLGKKKEDVGENCKAHLKETEQELKRKNETKIYALFGGNIRKDKSGNVIGYEGTIN